MSSYLKWVIRDELLSKLADDWLHAHCPVFSSSACAECIHVLGGMAGEW